MKACGWRGGCVVDVAHDEDLCTYHDKIRAGLITSTRDVGFGVVEVALTAAEREEAERRRRGYEASSRGP